MSGAEIPEGVGKTAVGVAMIRAEESRRPDRLFDDPYAEAFLRAAPGAFEAEQRAASERRDDMAAWGAAFWAHAVIRTRFFDDWLVGATRQGIRQVVLVAAGLDTRAYRLAWPDGTVVYELDLPEVFVFKDSVLAEVGAVPASERRVVPVDLRGDWTTPLLDSGLDRTLRSAWLIEGLMIYLSANEAARVLLAGGDLSASGSVVAFEYESLGTDHMRQRARRSKLMAPYTAMWKCGLPEPSDWLAANGWRSELHDRGQVATSYGRQLGQESAGGFVTASRV